jgi:diaminopropionate ammonia-lyase
MSFFEKSGDGKILWTSNENAKFFKRPGESGADISAFETPAVKSARRFHATFPGYEPTPLRRLDALSASLGLGALYVKDESFRFGLNAFKVLGGSYAMARYVAKRAGVPPEEMTYGKLTSEEARRAVKGLTFAATTDGNHGRGVAWTARVLGCAAEVFMPKGSSPYRAAKIAEEGAAVTIRDVNYDESVRMTAEEARENNWVVVQDTAWPGYEEIPLWIMQGYGTMADEAFEQIAGDCGGEPTHIFVQAGVGSMAAAIQAVARTRFTKTPRVIVAEADRADCFYRSAVRGEGKPVRVGGDLDTIMAGLACGEPNAGAYEILRDYASAFVSCPDYVAALGMRILGNPLGGDARVVSGESGAVTAGLVYLIMTDAKLGALKIALGLNEKSRVLIFSTEGDTDPENYRKIVWGGAYSPPENIQRRE